jgi:TolA-binding protein
MWRCSVPAWQLLGGLVQKPEPGIPAMRGPPLRWSSCLLLVLFGLAPEDSLRAQDTWGPGKSFTCLRRVQLPQGAPLPTIVVTEFFTHAELQRDGRNLAIYDSGDRPVPWRLLQVGPGDFCRVAFQTVPKLHTYRIYYGGQAPGQKPPAWTNSAGLLLETHRWRNCDLNRAASVREALAASELIGSDYVLGVFHRFNPFAPDPKPFLSRYRGTLHIGTAGLYAFFTSSEDCSFLLIDGQEVVAAPGRHGPIGDARLRGEVKLTAGRHEFEYLHAAAGPEACMVAAWQPPNAAQPGPIPEKAFAFETVVHLPAPQPEHSKMGKLREFSVEIVSEVPLADSADPLLRVQFRELPPRLGRPGRMHWEFGDGQVSESADPVHVYLHPGLYTVRMSSPSGGSVISNRVQLSRALVLADDKRPQDELRQYLPLLDSYEASKLDGPGLLQLARVYEQTGRFAKAAQVGKTFLQSRRLPRDSDLALAVARIAGPLYRDRLNDPESALAVWQAAAAAGAAESELEAADICLHDMLRRDQAREFLDAATRRSGVSGLPDLQSRLHRIWGDWHARGGDKQAALKAYARAASARASRRTAAQDEARRGAFSRSTEAFLRDGQLERAGQELRSWQDEFPADKVEGYLSLLQARWWMARSKYRQALATAGDLLIVNPESPYADQLAFHVAECEEKLHRVERAVAAYKSIGTDYPGSPLVEAARKKAAEIEARAKKP